MSNSDNFIHVVGFPVTGLEFLNEEEVVVAGGGGAGNSGIKNQIKLMKINFEERTLEVKAEIELSSKEDAPTSIAINHKKKVLACGINGSDKALKEGTNKSLKIAKIEGKKIVITESKRVILNRSVSDYQKVTKFNGDGTILLIASEEGQFSVLEFPSLEPKFSPKKLENEDFCDADIDYDNEFVATASDKAIHFFSFDNGALTETIEAPRGLNKSPCKFRCIRFGKNETSDFVFLGINTKDRKRSYVSKFKSPNFEKTMTRSVGFCSINAMAINEAGTYIALAFSDQTIKICSTKTLRVLKTIKNAHKFAITTLAFSPDSSYLISGSFDGDVRVYSISKTLSSNSDKLLISLLICFLLLLTIIWGVLTSEFGSDTIGRFISIPSSSKDEL